MAVTRDATIGSCSLGLSPAPKRHRRHHHQRSDYHDGVKGFVRAFMRKVSHEPITALSCHDPTGHLRPLRHSARRGAGPRPKGRFRVGFQVGVAPLKIRLPKRRHPDLDLGVNDPRSHFIEDGLHPLGSPRRTLTVPVKAVVIEANTAACPVASFLDA